MNKAQIRLLLPLLSLMIASAARAQHAFQVFLPGLAPAGRHPVVGTPDGGFCILAEQMDMESYESRFVLIKTTPGGEIEWARQFLTANEMDHPLSLRSTPDGGFIAVGVTSNLEVWNQNILVIRTNAHGYPVWSRIYDWSPLDWGSDVAPMADGSAIIVGRAQRIDSLLSVPEDAESEETPQKSLYEQYSGDHALAFRIDPDGNVIWGEIMVEPEPGEEENHPYESYANAVCPLKGNSAAMIVQRHQYFQSSIAVNIGEDGKVSSGCKLHLADDSFPFYESFINDLAPTPEGDLMLAGVVRRYSEEISMTSDRGILIRMRGDTALWSKTTSYQGKTGTFPMTVVPVEDDRYLLAGESSLFPEGSEYAEDENGGSPMLAAADGNGMIVDAKQWLPSFDKLRIAGTDKLEPKPYLSRPLVIPTDDRGAFAVATLRQTLDSSDEGLSSRALGLLLTRFAPDFTVCGENESKSIGMKVEPFDGTQAIADSFDNQGLLPIDAEPVDYRMVPPPSSAPPPLWLVWRPEKVDYPAEEDYDYKEEEPTVDEDRYQIDSDPIAGAIAIVQGNDISGASPSSPKEDSKEMTDDEIEKKYSIEIVEAPDDYPDPDAEYGDFEENNGEDLPPDSTLSILMPIDVTMKYLSPEEVTTPNVMVKDLRVSSLPLCQGNGKIGSAAAPSEDRATESEYLRLLPNTIRKGKTISVEFRLVADQKPEIALINIGQGEAVRQIGSKNVSWSPANGVGKTSIETAGLPPGTYLVRLRSGEKQLTAKLEVQ